MQFQRTAEVLEVKGVIAAFGVHGELVDGVLNVGLRDGEGVVHAVGGQGGGIEGAERCVAGPCCRR